jgi:hypothetical protein
MRPPATRLDIPGQPALLDEREGEPMPSRFTGKPLRRIRWTLEVYGDNAQEQLSAVLTAASTGGELIPYGQGPVGGGQPQLLLSGWAGRDHISP